jgi:hypothetical protein
VIPDPSTPTPSKTRRGRRGVQRVPEQPSVAARPSKLDQIVSMLVRPEGASLAELVAATGWQAHSVRGALAGSLKKKGHVIRAEKLDGKRRYRIGAGE